MQAPNAALVSIWNQECRRRSPKVDGRTGGRVDWVAKVIDGNDGRDHPEPTGGWLMGQDFMTDD